MAARHDAAGFLAAELERREALPYPPFAHLVRVELSATDAEAAQAGAERVAEVLRPGLPAGASLLGPAPRFRLRGKHRRQLPVKSAERGPAIDAVRSAVDDVAKALGTLGVAIAVDADPS